MTYSPAWDRVTDVDVVRGLKEYDQLVRPASGESGKTGAARVLGKFGFTVLARR
jgi:hypothetical protein